MSKDVTKRKKSKRKRELKYDLNNDDTVLNICDNKLEKLCIICNGSCNLKSLNESYLYLGIEENYCKMIKTCFNIQFNVGLNDTIDAICITCSGRLRQCLEFRKDIELAYDRYRSYIKKGCNALKRTVTNTAPKSSNNYISPRSHLLNNLKQEFYDIKEEEIPTEISITNDLLKLEEQSDDFTENNDDFIDNYEFKSDTDWSVTSEEMDKATGHPIDVKKENIQLPELDPSSTTCPICSMEIFDSNLLFNHYQKHNAQAVCYICGYRSATKNITSHFDTHKINTHTCPLCDRTFKMKNSLSHHIKTFHRKQKLHKCSICNERFKGSRTKRNHMMKEHGTKFNMEQCQFCEKAFFSLYLLKKHTEAVHQKKKNVFCSICGRGFFRDFELKNHLVSHSGVKDHECEYCGKCFGRKKTLKEHLKIHLNIKKFKCEFCDKAFVQKCALKGHLKTHGL